MIDPNKSPRRRKHGSGAEIQLLHRHRLFRRGDARLQLQGNPCVHGRGLRHAGIGSSLNCFQSRKPVSATPVPPAANPAPHIHPDIRAQPRKYVQAAQSPRETASESPQLQQLFLCLQHSCVASLSPSSSLLSLSKHSPAFDEFAASIWGITLRMRNTLLFKH